MSPVPKVASGKKQVHVWKVKPCKTCGSDVAEHKDGTYLLSVVYSARHKSSSWGWAHKKCVGSEVKK
jgi:hypothetical protein